MTSKERLLALLDYKPADRMPAVHFGFWRETVEKWSREGHISESDAAGWEDNNAIDRELERKLGFDFNWAPAFYPPYPPNELFPPFERRVLRQHPGGNREVVNEEGVVVLESGGGSSIPMEIEHLLKDRASWEQEYLPRLQFTPERVDKSMLNALAASTAEGRPLGLYCGSLIGKPRNWLGVEELSYLYYDDEPLFEEILNTVSNLAYDLCEYVLATGVQFSYALFWEDICYNKGPLVIPAVYREKLGHHYKRISGLLRENGVRFVSLDCDGCIDTLLPIWLENGVNVMFPIEVGTWGASIAPWRETYGKELRGVGGMNKNVLGQDYAAIDRELERLKPLVALGGYIPCPDHRIAPDAKWENVQYYAEKIKRILDP